MGGVEGGHHGVSFPDVVGYGDLSDEVLVPAYGDWIGVLLGKLVNEVFAFVLELTATKVYDVRLGVEVCAGVVSGRAE